MTPFYIYRIASKTPPVWNIHELPFTKLATVEHVAWLESSIVKSYELSLQWFIHQMFSVRFGTWVLVRLLGVAGKCLWALWSLGARPAAGSAGCRKAPHLAKMWMGLWSRRQKFRFQPSKSKRKCDGVGKNVHCGVALHGRWACVGKPLNGWAA